MLLLENSFSFFCAKLTLNYIYIAYMKRSLGRLVISQLV
ncbi:hypothetical protein LEP1GSC082_4256 [Leptospira kirschneri str. H2]|nr:hypothetical protein LEP1GSC082_4256 [Leptospira kirschneri str. H2]